MSEEYPHRRWPVDVHSQMLLWTRYVCVCLNACTKSMWVGQYILMQVWPSVQWTINSLVCKGTWSCTPCPYTWVSMSTPCSGKCSHRIHCQEFSTTCWYIQTQRLDHQHSPNTCFVFNSPKDNSDGSCTSWWNCQWCTSTNSYTRVDESADSCLDHDTFWQFALTPQTRIEDKVDVSRENSLTSNKVACMLSNQKHS